MTSPSVGHLEHFDENAPYIAYVRFEESHKNRAYKPIDFYKLLMERYADISIIQPYIKTRGSHSNVYAELLKKKKLEE